MIAYISQFVNGEENVVTVLLFMAAIVIGGYSLFKVGFQNLLRLDFDMKTLMTVAIIGALLSGNGRKERSLSFFSPSAKRSNVTRWTGQAIDPLLDGDCPE